MSVLEFEPEPEPELGGRYALSPRAQHALDGLQADGIGEELAQWREQLASRGRMVSSEDQAAKAASLLQRRLRVIGERDINNGIARLAPAEEQAVVQGVLHDMFGAGQRLQRILDDPRVLHVDANGCDEVWISYVDGTVVRGPALWRTDEEMIEELQRFGARASGSERRFDATTARMLLRLPGGERLFAVRSVSDRPSMSVRRQHFPDATLAELQGLGMFDEELAEFGQAAVAARLNIVIGGAMFAGKTTLQLALLNAVDPDERIVTIEDVRELGLKALAHRHRNVVELEAREANSEGQGAVTMAALVKDAMKMNVRRLIVGEVTGGEVFHMLNAMSSGSDGSISTLHARSSLNIFHKITTYLALSEERLSEEASARLISETVDLVIFVGLRRGRRQVSSVRAVTELEGGRVTSVELFRPDATGRAVWTGIQPRPDVKDRLTDAGWDVRRFNGTRTVGDVS